MVIHNIIEMQRHNRGPILPKLVTLFYAISEPTESDKRYWSHKIMSLSMIFGQSLKHYDRYVYIASGLGAKTNESLDDERDIWRKTIKNKLHNDKKHGGYTKSDVMHYKLQHSLLKEMKNRN
jgi:hypothetical protein